MWKLVLFLITLCNYSYLSNAYKILIVIPTPSKSHAILGDGLVKHLSEAGHEITYITAFPPKTPQSRVTIVDVSDIVPPSEEPLNIKDLMNKTMEAKELHFILPLLMELSKVTIEHPKVQNLIADKNQQFDVIIAEWLINDIYAGFAGVYNCPLIWFSPIEPHWAIIKLVDESPNPAYSISVISASIPPLTFKQRVAELFYHITFKFLQIFWISWFDNDLYEKYFVPVIRDRRNIVPSLDTLKDNGSLVLSNSHISMGMPVRLPQNFISIGGFHIDNNVKPLPQDLQKLMDEAKYGVIYFSMGSNLRSKHFPSEIKVDLLKMFGKMKQIVLWKFEEDLPNRPSNVHILKWAPQQSILAHKNCILFISHGGLLSTTETIHFGVPTIGIPGFGDQFINVERSVKKGFAKKVDLSYKIVADLKLAIEDMLDDPKYTAKAKELSKIYHDRVAHPAKELIHWVEHVITTQGAPHLRSPAFLVPWYQKLYLDLGVLLLILVLILRYIFAYIYRCIKANLVTRTKLKVN